MKDDFHKFLRSRRSVRRFKPDPIAVNVIQRILETATYAPSAHDLQPWRFAILTNSEAKTHLAETVAGKFRQDMIVDGVLEADIQALVARTLRRARKAPAIVILCRDSTRVNPQPDEIRQQAEVIMGTQSVAVAGLQLLLAAHAEGLAGSWICWSLFAPQETRTALNLPEEWEPQGMFFLGYPVDLPVTPERIRLEEITRWI
jgi:coenzyme F420-0:L-glutamate ligase / coenzyme F420-1:gamma-L-glutamate ligase